MKVICPSCKRSFWETTDKYDPNKPPNGSMVRQLDFYRKNHWPVFGDGVMIASAGTLAAEMDCPACLAQLAPSGRLRVIEEEKIDETEVLDNTAESSGDDLVRDNLTEDSELQGEAPDTDKEIKDEEETKDEVVDGRIGPGNDGCVAEGKKRSRKRGGQDQTETV